MPSKPQAQAAAVPLEPAKVGMLCFLLSEVAFFSTLIMSYVVFLRQTKLGHPSPEEVFHLPLVIVSTLCLLTSSFTVHLAEKALVQGERSRFLRFWGLTIVLGAAFLGFTALEWSDLIFKHGLTLSRNMFGSTYFTVVGFHAAHVTAGLILMSIVFVLYLRRRMPRTTTAAEVISWYWHFVDGVWVVVFTLVYLIGR